MSGARFSLCLLCTSALAGCLDTDAAIFVDPSVESPELAVTDGTLGGSVQGSFDLVLHLGARASGPSAVSYTSFTLRSAADDSVLVESLPVTASQAAPIAVEPGGDDPVVTFTIDSGADLLEKSAIDAICAGPVRIRGTIDDSLATGPTPVVSEPFSATGCP